MLKDKKGFAVSGILYPLFIIFIGLIIGLVGTYVNRKLLFDRMKQDVLSEVDYGKNILEGGMLLYYKGSVEPITVDGVLKVPDMSGNGNHGEMVNFKSNMRNEGGKIVFDGTNNYVKAPNVLNGRSTFTIEMLYLPKKQGVSQYYFGLTSNQFGLQTTDASTHNFYYNTSKNVSINSGGNGINQLTYVAYVVENGKVTSYIDGKKITTSTLSGGLNVSGSYLGLGATGTGTNFAQMDCFSFRIYSYALNEDEIYHNYRIDYNELTKNTVGDTSHSNGNYVTNGLMVDLDGVNNAGNGSHNSNTSTTKSVWKDSSGNQNDCTLSGFNYSTSSGWNEIGLTFDGVDDTCILDDLKPTQFTISLALTPYSYNSRHVVFTRWYGYTVEINADGTVSFGMDATAGSSYLKTTSNVTFGQVNYITVTFDGTKMLIYLNGVKAAERNSTYLNYGNNKTNDTRISHNFYDAPFKGIMHHVMMYDRALTQSEVTQNYNTDKSRY